MIIQNESNKIDISMIKDDSSICDWRQIIVTFLIDDRKKYLTKYSAAF